MKEFEKLGINEPILKVLEQEGFEKPTEIQEKSIPVVLQGNDVIAGSATGSGKTLAFGVGMIQNAQPGKGIQALILTPTRELAEQIRRALNKFSNYKLNISAIYGGMPISPQINSLEKAEIVVGTPGRILDHLERQTINLKQIKTLVLDEADRMLDMGFIDEVGKIISQCPKQRQTLLFSATISSDIEYMSKKFLNSPIEISATPQVDPENLTQIYYDIQDNLKFSLLVHLLKNEKSGLVMVFCNTRNNVDFITGNLTQEKIEAHSIHGGFSQEKRNRIIKDFHSKKAHILVCTDVAARGLDIKGVSHIYNYDLPKESKDYIHRIGRTARAGKQGKVISIVTSRDYENFSRIKEAYPEIEITNIKTPYVEQIRIKYKGRPIKPDLRGQPRTHRLDKRGYQRDAREQPRDSRRFRGKKKIRRGNQEEHEQRGRDYRKGRRNFQKKRKNYR